jgi:hypothetical protein
MLQNFSQHAPSGTRAPLSLRGFRLISSQGHLTLARVFGNRVLLPADK